MQTRPAVAIAGATGFIGRSLAEALSHQYRVIGLARTPQPDSLLEWRSCDLFSLLQVEKALEGAEQAFYLVHSMLPSAHLTQGAFQDMDLICADNFARAAARAGVRHITYLGGLIPADPDLSLHLRSRLEVEQALGSRGVPVTALRAGIVIGPGGSSFRILRAIVERLPIIPCPAWSRSLTQPAVLDDVLALLRHCAENPASASRAFDIGSSEIMSYRAMLERTAKVLGLERTFVDVPLRGTAFCRRWVSLVTGAPQALVAPLLESARHSMVCRDRRLQEAAGVPGIPFDVAVKSAVVRETVLTRKGTPLPALCSRVWETLYEYDVRSVQRMPLPKGKSARWAAEEYSAWLPRLFKFLLRAEVDAKRNLSIRLPFFKRPLVEFKFAHDRGDAPDRQLFYISGGLLAKVVRRPARRPRLEFREALGGRQLLVAVHDYRPSLPWPLYSTTQALVHLFAMRAFAAHLARLGRKTSAAPSVFWKLFASLLRLPLYILIRIFYRIHVEGRLPESGPGLLIANHVSFIDPFLLAAVLPRPVRFLMDRGYYDLPVANWCFRALGAIPISDRDRPKAILRSFGAARAALRNGELVCVFAEGEISRHGLMQRFKKGYERIVSGMNVPLIPAHLDRVWGSIFSFAQGKVLLKWPRRIPYPVTVSFGPALPPTADTETIRKSVEELGVAAFAHQLKDKPTLPRAWVREAKRHWFRTAMADDRSGNLSCGAALVRAYVLGGMLDEFSSGRSPLGVLLPPCVPAALVNLGLPMHGRLPVNLSYAVTPETARACARRAGVSAIITSRVFLEKIGWRPGPDMIFLEDLAPRVSKLRAAATAAAFFFLPTAWLEALFLRRAARSPRERAAILFTSGSTGEPKGVVLTHANIQANIEALAQVYGITASDRLLGALPFFHAFGLTVTVWMPPLAGYSAVFHPNPLDAKTIGELLSRHGVTILLGTPTFLAGYTRRIAPAQMNSVRLAIAGGEKLRPEVARAFADKFGFMPMEGFGCTELSPVACVNIPDVEISGVRQVGAKPGSIGRPLPGSMVRIVDPETFLPLPDGDSGMLLVKGPNVMAGYLDDPIRTAEVIRDGYYVTGDIAKLDADGFVFITDRLSRFSKIGGEMVPHALLEQKLHDLAERLEQTFVVAAVPDDRKGERLVVLCKDYEDVAGIWRKMTESDLPRLWIPDPGSFHSVPRFPLLGSGKLDLAALKAMARELER